MVHNLVSIVVIWLNVELLVQFCFGIIQMLISMCLYIKSGCGFSIAFLFGDSNIKGV
jgi:hypothetical protein